MGTALKGGESWEVDAVGGGGGGGGVGGAKHLAKGRVRRFGFRELFHIDF